MASQALQELHARLYRECVGDRHPFILTLDSSLQALDSKGEASHYGIDAFEIGKHLYDILPILDQTMTDLPDEEFVLPFIEFENGAIGDIHILPLEQATGLMLIDTSQEHRQRVSDQQVSNELLLLKEKQNLLLNDLQRASLVLEDKNHELEEAGRAKSHFIASMSHEFRTPLTSILGYSQLLRDATADVERADTFLDAIDRGAQNLMLMIDNLLEQASIEAGEIKIQHVPSNLRNLFRDINELFEPLALRKGIDLILKIETLPQHEVYSDPIRLRQIIVNLAGNAVKFTDEGSVTIEAIWGEDLLDVRVRDTGPGIPEKDQQRIFSPFKRSQLNGKTKKGAGLGLAISRYLTERLDGILTLKSAPGTGTLFQFSIPAIEVEETQGIEENSRPAIAATILIVEDDEDIRALMELNLQYRGYQTLVSSSGEEAFDIAMNNPVDLVLMDINMPGMSGDMAASKLRAAEFSKPIIALTASIFRDEALACGCNDYVKKPADMDQLIEKIESHLI